MDRAYKILDLKERREFYLEYKDQFPQAKYLSIQGVRSIKNVNEYCGNKVEIDKIEEIYKEIKNEFQSNITVEAKDILGIFEKAIKAIYDVKNYDEELQRKLEQQLIKERKKSREMER